MSLIFECERKDHFRFYLIFLTEDGDVYVWGGGSEGQLGFGASETEVPKPTKLDLEEKVVCISCGYYHTSLVTGLFSKRILKNLDTNIAPTTS